MSKSRHDQKIKIKRDIMMSTHDSAPKVSRRKRVKVLSKPPSDQPAVSPLPPRDDLLSIEGINPATEMALNSIGIRRFADFRGYTPESLAQALQKRTGISIAATTIANQDWIGWAELLATENSSSAPDDAAGEVSLFIQQARFQQVQEPPAPNKAAGKILRSEIDCLVLGAPVSDATTDRIALCAQIYAVNTASEEYKLLASQLERFDPNRNDYRFHIEFETPKAGRYQLQIVTFLLKVDPEIAFHQGPILHVIP